MQAPALDIGMYGPRDVTWRVNREAVLLAGGGRALLLQVAHPLVAAGVEQHSSYATDPWGRLYRTLELTTTIIFGDPAASDRASKILRGRHARVQGEAADGTRYDARDPDLLLWVWATLVESSLLIYTRYVRPLSAPDVERYYAEQQRFALACGIPAGHWPATYAAFTDYYARTIAEELRVTEDSRLIADSVVRPDIPVALKPAFELVNLATIGLLPPSVREQYGWSWGPRRQRLLSASTTAIRHTLPLLPSLMREFPPARQATRRARAA